MRKFTAILLLIGLISLSGCIFEKKGDDTEGLTEEIEAVEDIEPSKEAKEILKDTETYAEILMDEKAKSSDCNDIDNAEIKETCEQKFIYDSAIAAKDSSKCEQLSELADQEMCMAEILE
ncbi:MAG: hypothetical protein ABII07_03645 [Patescibacteria group bacterium]